MAPRYAAQQLVEYEESRQLWLDRGRDLLDAIFTHKFASVRAAEYARTGLARRLGYLDHAFERVAVVYPPNVVGASRERVRDAELLLQAFVMNVFGAIDNLAWVWGHERQVRARNGSPLSPSQLVFVGPRSGELAGSLTPRLRQVIQDAGEWFRQIGAYRHGVAHQIPIYIPRLLGKADLAEAERLDVLIQAALDKLDAAAFGELLDRRHRLGDYGPMMALGGEQRPMMLHPQMVCDFATVVNFGEILFDELKRVSL